MPISDSKKTDFLWKKTIYGVTDTDATGGKEAPNEQYGSKPIIFGEDIWTESDLITIPAPGSSDSYVQYYPIAGALRCISDPTVANRRTWIAVIDIMDPIDNSNRLRDWVPVSLDVSYAIKVYAGDPNTTGTLLNPLTTNEEWVFDYSAGVLTFPNNVPSLVTSNDVYLVGYKYIGQTGVSPNSFTLNSQTGDTQTLVVGTTGTDFGIASAANVHTFNLPDASQTARGVINIGAQDIAGNKDFHGRISLIETPVRFYSGAQYAEIKNAATYESNLTYLLPEADPEADQVLSASAPAAGIVTLTWADSSGGGHIIESDGTPLTQRDNLNFSADFVVADNDPDTDVDLLNIHLLTNDTYFGSAVTHPTPVAHSLRATGGSGTNIAGANLILAGGQSTGQGLGGRIQFKVALPDAGSGSSLNPLFTAAEFRSKSETISELLVHSDVESGSTIWTWDGGSTRIQEATVETQNLIITTAFEFSVNGYFDVVPTAEPSAPLSNTRVYYDSTQERFLYYRQADLDWFPLSPASIGDTISDVVGTNDGILYAKSSEPDYVLTEDGDDFYYNDSTKTLSVPNIGATLITLDELTSDEDEIVFSKFIKLNEVSGDTGELRFYELAANGSHYYAFKAPTSIGASRELFWPSADPSAGQVLSASAPAGSIITLSWSTVTSGHTIKLGGSPLTQRAGLNFNSNFLVTDDSGNNETDVDLATGIELEDGVADLHITMQSTTLPGINIDGISSQSADYILIEDNSGNDLLKYRADRSLELLNPTSQPAVAAASSLKIFPFAKTSNIVMPAFRGPISTFQLLQESFISTAWAGLAHPVEGATTLSIFYGNLVSAGWGNGTVDKNIGMHLQATGTGTAGSPSTLRYPNALAIFRDSSTNPKWGTGFLFYTRIVINGSLASFQESGASTGVRIMIGPATATQVNDDDVGGDRAAFSWYHTNGGIQDTNWYFETKDNTTQTRVDTSMAFAGSGTIYDMWIYCPDPYDTIYWSIVDVTNSTVQSGSTTTTLPRQNIGMYAQTSFNRVNAVARDFRFCKGACLIPSTLPYL